MWSEIYIESLNFSQYESLNPGSIVDLNLKTISKELKIFEKQFFGDDWYKARI